jgi:hypothetical protein
MEAVTQGVPGYYVWEIPGKPVAVHLHLDVVDRLLAEVMRGFGAVPKRGAEVGGILLGTIEDGDTSIVRIEDFEPVACEYKRGPSYAFAGEDGREFEEACERWRPDASRPAYAVGYFRSHTRDGLALSAEDIELLARHFPAPSHVALLIKPFATKVSTAGIFFREEGIFQGATPLEFAFRRREMTGEEAPPRRSMIGARRRVRQMQNMVPAALAEQADDDYAEEPVQQYGAAYSLPEPHTQRLRPGWSWIPLFFIFLLLGVALGFQLALSIGFKPTGGAGAPDYSLSLSVTNTGDNLSVKWNRQAPPVRAAQSGLLEIEDGNSTKSVDLDAAQLQNGSIIYRNSSDTVRFRLVVYPKTGVSVTETVEWHH